MDQSDLDARRRGSPEAAGLPVSPGFRTLLRAAAAATWLLVTMGGVVCMTGSTYGCPDWPGCFGRALPPLRTSSVIEWTHRASVLVATAFVLAAAVVGWRRTQAGRWVRVAPVVVVALFAVVSVFGAFAVLTGLPRWAAAIDLGAAVLALALMVAAASAAGLRRVRPGRRAPGPDTVLGRLALATTLGAYLVLVGGVLVAEPGSIVRCLGWPLFDAASLTGAADRWLALERYGLAVATMVGVVALPIVAWRRGGRRSDPGPGALTRALVPAALLAAILVLGKVVPMGDASLGTLIAYVALTTALWASLVALTTRTVLPSITRGATRGSVSGAGAIEAGRS